MGIINFTDIERKITEIEKDIEFKTLRKFQQIAIQIDQAVVLATPRDTGRAALNWLPSINSPILKPNNGAAGNPSSIIAEAHSVIKDSKLGDTIFITNNVSYIGHLDDGSSKQAPAGFVEKAVQAAQSTIT